MKKRKYLSVIVLVMALLTGCSLINTGTTPTEPVQIETEPTIQPPTASEHESIEPFPGPEESSLAEAPKGEGSGNDIIIATDIHYLSQQLTDYGQGFTYMVEHGDGKVVNYISEILAAFLDEVIKNQPDALVLSGDLSLNGEKLSHTELAEKLEAVEAAGIPVIVIPGNHDINNTSASAFEGSVKFPAQHVTSGEFAEIYQDYGYKEAISRDTASLSYVYQLDEDTRLMMLDTSQYEPVNLVGGMVRRETYGWIETQMEDAWEQGMNVLPISHHNLLDQSEIYVENCTIEHSEQLIDQLESWQTPLYLSGHLHVQHLMRAYDGTGIYEVSTSSLATPPCQYGVLHFEEDGSFRYHTQAVDVAAWARRTGNTDENLQNFSDYSSEFLKMVFFNQAQDEFEKLDTMKGKSQYEKELMAQVYSELNSAYYGGRVVEVKDIAVKEPGYHLWTESGYSSLLLQYLEYIVKDGTQNYNMLISEP